MKYIFAVVLLSIITLSRNLPVHAAGTTGNVAACARAWEKIASYTAVISVYERLHDQRESMQLDYAFAKPANVKIHVLAGPNAGAFLNWSGGSTIQARRGSGILGLLRRNLKLHEALATTIRGSSIDRLSYGAILEHIGRTKGTLSIDPANPMKAILRHDDPAADGGLTREEFEFSPATHLLTKAFAYEGDMLVRRVEFTDVRVEETKRNS